MARNLFVRLIAGAAYCAAIVGFAPPVFAADTYFSRGVAYYNRADYKQAQMYFDQAVRSDTGDYSALYYEGLCYQQMKMWQKAADTYTQVVQRFPASPAAANARKALKSFDRGYLNASSQTTNAPAVSSSRAPEPESQSVRHSLAALDENTAVEGPQQSRIYYTQTDNASGIDFIVDATINGRPLKMDFDTGASTVVLGKNHLAQLGLPPIPADRHADGRSVGVGGSINNIWVMRYDIKVGQMELKNCPVMVQDSMFVPLLGETFFKHFTYTIDYGSKSIMLARKDGATVVSGGITPAGNYDIPFVREGNEMLVTAQVNGRPYQFYFDTGAMQICLSRQDIAKLGIDIPDDARQGFSRGVGGTTQTWNFPVRFIKCGPIEKRDVEVSVADESHMGHPLLGQPFYAGWQYTIDNANSVIHLLRR